MSRTIYDINEPVYLKFYIKGINVDESGEVTYSLISAWNDKENGDALYGRITEDYLSPANMENVGAAADKWTDIYCPNCGTRMVKAKVKYPIE